MKKCPKCETMYAEEDGRGGVCGRCYTNSRGGSMERDMDWLRQGSGPEEIRQNLRLKDLKNLRSSPGRS